MKANRAPMNSAPLPQIPGLDRLQFSGADSSFFFFRARLADADKTVAVCVRPLAAVSVEKKERFKASAGKLPTLNHPALSKQIACGITSDGLYAYVISEYSNGKALAERIKSHDRLSAHQISGIVLQVLDCLAHAHEHKVVHGCINPGNVLLEPGEAANYRVKLMGFGFSALFEPGEISQAQGASEGKTYSETYLSPEQCSGQAADERSDIYALGCIIYEMIFGKAVFERNRSRFDLLSTKQNEDVKIDRSEHSRSALGDEMLALLESSLSRSPSLRPQNIREFRQRFLKAMGSMQELCTHGPEDFLLGSQSGAKMPMFAAILLPAIVLIVLCLLYAAITGLHAGP